MSGISKLAAALVKAQSEMKSPAMDSVNPHFKSKFASLKAVREAVIPTLNKHGIAVIQPAVEREDGIGVRTILVHESGETLDCGVVSLPVAGNAQAFVSAMTYCERRGLASGLSVSADPDDDGNEAAKAKDKPAQKKKESKGKNYEFLKKMGEMKKALGDERYYQILGSHGYEKSSEIEKREHQIAVWKELDMVIKAEEEMNNDG